MAVTVQCGHMTFDTTAGTPVKNPQVPGVNVAASNKSKLSYSFPKSPMNGIAANSEDAQDGTIGHGAGLYLPAYVSTLRPRMLRNSVRTTDQGDAEGYWGFSTTDTTEVNPSGVDLMYGGSPDFETMPAFMDWDGASGPEPIIASRYMPNLLPPMAGENINFSPIADNPTPVVLGDSNNITEANPTANIISLPPGQGAGHATNPSQTAAQIKNKLSTEFTEEEQMLVSPPLPSPVTLPINDA